MLLLLASLGFSTIAEFYSQERISHPVGTTVRVVDFLKQLPVRRQNALKNSAKTAANIKDVLQAYAMARPSVRLSFKVLKAKNDKLNWVYAPKSGAAMMDAALKVASKRAVEQCQWHEWSSSPSADLAVMSSPGDIEAPCFIVQSLLPRKDCG